MADRKIILKQNQCPGDVLTMTRALADLKTTYPEWQIDVRTFADALFENSPHITKLDESDPEVEVYEVSYPAINISGWSGLHFSDGFRMDIEDKLNSNPEKVILYGETKIQKTQIKPELWISDEEKSWFSQVHCEYFTDLPFWVLNAGIKKDNELKEYPFWEEVVDYFNQTFSNKINLVQIGADDVYHKHPKLNNVIDFVGRTDMRQLIRLMYHAHGSVGAISFPFVISAALGQSAVVVAGGKEGPRWHSYNWIDFHHVVGRLKCCQYDGCWLGGDLGGCSDIVNINGKNVPRCFTLITPEEVVQSIQKYYQGGMLDIPSGIDVFNDSKNILVVETDYNMFTKLKNKYYMHRLFFGGSLDIINAILGHNKIDIVFLGKMSDVADDVIQKLLKEEVFIVYYDNLWIKKIDNLEGGNIEYRPYMLERI